MRCTTCWPLRRWDLSHLFYMPEISAYYSRLCSMIPLNTYYSRNYAGIFRPGLPVWCDNEQIVCTLWSSEWNNQHALLYIISMSPTYSQCCNYTCCVSSFVAWRGGGLRVRKHPPDFQLLVSWAWPMSEIANHRITGYFRCLLYGE